MPVPHDPKAIPARLEHGIEFRDVTFSYPQRPDVPVLRHFTLRVPGDRLSIRIDDYIGAERTLTSTLAGPRRELTGARLAWYSLKYPAITLRIIALIHWHAALLWFRRLPWFAKAARATDQRDLYRPHPSIAHSAPALGAKLPVSTEAA